MAENGTSTDVTNLKTELEQALSALDLALLEAGRSVSLVRNNMTRVLELADHAAEMESAIIRAREQLAVSFTSEAGTPPLRAVPAPEEAPAQEEAPAPEPAEEPAEAVQEPANEPVAEIVEAPAAEDQLEEPEQAVEEPAEQPEEVKREAEVVEPATATRCLRLKVSKKSGSLDLKDVDGSVNENASVMDVALLDYDGRQATLKLWVNEKSDPKGVREALLTSLRNHLGEAETELDIDFEEENAA